MDIAILAAAMISLTVLCFFLALAGGDAGVRARLRTLWSEPEGPEQRPRATVKERLIAPFTEALVQLLTRLLPSKTLARQQQRLVLAGEPMTLSGFLTLQALTATSFVFLAILVVSTGAFSGGVISLAVIVGAGVVGFLLPQLWLQQRASQRASQIIKSLPDSFDLITTCVEAGLGLDAALARVAEKVEGPFADELRRTLRDIALGKLRRDAMRELGERTNVPDLVTFVNAVVQAEEMGSSIGNVLRVQSEQLRTRRRQRAEEQAYKAPVKMLFPLVLCIFPTLFIVILGPAVITIMQEFPR